MSRIPHNTKNENEIFDFATKFMKDFQIGKLLFQCNAGKLKGIPVIDVFRYLFLLVFSDRSMYMQQKTGVFDLGFCKNTVYRFLNNTKMPAFRANDKNLICDAERFDGRSLAGKRRRQSRCKATDVMIDLVKTAQQSGLTAKYVLFDNWFSSPKIITALKKERNLDVIAMVKKSSKVKYAYQGKMLNIKEIYSRNRKRRGRSKYLLSIEVTVGEQEIPAKIVCVRNRSKKKDWLAIISTDTGLSEEKIIRIYGKRLDIEVFFKSCKSYLHFINSTCSDCIYTVYDAFLCTANECG